MDNGALSITDKRTGKSYEIPISDGAIRAMDLRQIKTTADDFGLMTYDPAFMNTASCRSAITYIDGDRGILRYRGYPIEQLAERASFLEVAYLLAEGELLVLRADALDLQALIEVEHDRVARRQDARAHDHAPLDGPFLRIDAHREVVVDDVEARLLRGERPAGREHGFLGRNRQEGQERKDREDSHRSAGF